MIIQINNIGSYLYFTIFFSCIITQKLEYDNERSSEENIKDKLEGTSHVFTSTLIYNVASFYFLHKRTKSHIRHSYISLHSVVVIELKWGRHRHQKRHKTKIVTKL